MGDEELVIRELAIGNRISASQKSEELKGKEHMVLLAFTIVNGVLFGWLLYITVFAGYWGVASLVPGYSGRCRLSKQPGTQVRPRANLNTGKNQDDAPDS